MSSAAVGLPLDQLDFVVDALGAAVVPGQGEGGIDGRAVAFEPGGVGVQEGQVRCPDLGDPAGQRLGVGLRRGEQCGEVAYRGAVRGRAPRLTGSSSQGSR